MSAFDVLKAIVEEVAGASQPYSTDSYLPAHLIHDARMAIEAHERDKALAEDISLRLRIAAEDAQ